MTADVKSPAALVDELPPRPAQAEARTRTREEKPPAPGHAAWVQRAAAGVLTGDSLMHRQPPSLAQDWQRHMAQARRFNAGLLRWSRYGWAMIHMPIAVATALLRWATLSFWRAVITALVIYGIHWLI